MKDKKIKKKSFWAQLKRDKALILIVLPVVIHYLVFIYYPMYGNIIALRIIHPYWVSPKAPGLAFDTLFSFFESPYFFRVLRNTLLISVYSILWGFPIPIIFALMNQ